MGADKHQPFLDVARFFAALLVMLGHSRGLVLVGIDHVERPTIFVKALYLATGLQHEGVVIFFVVSGYLVGGAAWRAIRDDVFSFTTYFINRFSRIYLVYVPSLALCAVLAVAGAMLLTDTRFYSERPLFPGGVSSDWTIGQIPCHLFAVQGVLCQAWGANPALWSLGYEWVLYMIAPLAFFAAVGQPQVRRLIAGVAILAIFIVLDFADPDIRIWFPLWFFGAGAAIAGERYSVSAAVGGAALAVCGSAFVLSRMKIVPVEITDLVLALSFAAALSCRSLIAARFNASWIKRGAGFSYSLYLTHIPVGIFCGALLEHLGLFPHHLSQPRFGSLMAFAGLAAVTLVAANLFARITEDQTPEVRAYLRRVMEAREIIRSGSPSRP